MAANGLRRGQIRVIFSGKATTSQSARESSHDEIHDTGRGCAGHGGPGRERASWLPTRAAAPSRSASILSRPRHRRQPPRLPRDDVPLHRGDEVRHLRRHPLRRDHPTKGQGRHVAGRGDRGRRRGAGHQGRHRRQGARLLTGRGDHEGLDGLRERLEDYMASAPSLPSGGPSSTSARICPPTTVSNANAQALARYAALCVGGRTWCRSWSPRCSWTATSRYRHGAKRSPSGC